MIFCEILQCLLVFSVASVPGNIFLLGSTKNSSLQGLHASGNLAFVKDFESVFQQQDNERSRARCSDTLTVDSWSCAGAYLAMSSSSPLSDRGVWRQVWEQQVELLITFVSSSTKDDLALFSSSKFIGSYQLQLEAEKEMGDYIVRTLKMRNRGTTRTVTQLVFMSWPTAPGLTPTKSSFMSLIRESSEQMRARQVSGPVMVWSGADLGWDPVIAWMSLDTMSRQMSHTGDTNLSHYTRYLALTPGLQLTNSHVYIQLHDMLAWAIQNNKL